MQKDAPWVRSATSALTNCRRRASSRALHSKYFLTTCQSHVSLRHTRRLLLSTQRSPIRSSGLKYVTHWGCLPSPPLLKETNQEDSSGLFFSSLSLPLEEIPALRMSCSFRTMKERLRNHVIPTWPMRSEARLSERRGGERGDSATPARLPRLSPQSPALSVSEKQIARTRRPPSLKVPPTSFPSNPIGQRENKQGEDWWVGLLVKEATLPGL